MATTLYKMLGTPMMWVLLDKHGTVHMLKRVVTYVKDEWMTNERAVCMDLG